MAKLKDKAAILAAVESNFDKSLRWGILLDALGNPTNAFIIGIAAVTVVIASNIFDLAHGGLNLFIWGTVWALIASPIVYHCTRREFMRRTSYGQIHREASSQLNGDPDASEIQDEMLREYVEKFIEILSLFTEQVQLAKTPVSQERLDTFLREGHAQLSNIRRICKTIDGILATRSDLGDSANSDLASRIKQAQKTVHDRTELLQQMLNTISAFNLANAVSSGSKKTTVLLGQLEELTDQLQSADAVLENQQVNLERAARAAATVKAATRQGSADYQARLS